MTEQEPPTRATTVEQEQIIGELGRTFANLAAIAGTRAQDFLVLTNGGAAVACLALLSSESSLAKSVMVKLSLAIFVFGLLLAGVTMTRGYFYATNTATRFIELVPRIRAGSATWHQLQQVVDPHKAMRFYRTQTAIGCGSLMAFCIGAMTAMIRLLMPAMCAR